MSLANALEYAPQFSVTASNPGTNRNGSQSLLHIKAPPPNYIARIGAIVLYLAFLAGFATVGFRAADKPIEDEQVVELAPIPVDEQPVEDTPPPPEAIDIPEPPPPMAMDPIAPVEEVKPVEKPKVEKRVEPREEHRPTPAPRTQTRPVAAKPAPPHPAAVPAVRAPAAPLGATPSAIANQFHACMQRAASNFDAPRSGRVSYHASFSATGSLTSYSISSSGNSALDGIANRLGGRCGSVAAPGKPVSLSGSITFAGP